MGINNLHFRPLHSRVLVKRLEAAHETASGIAIPDVALEKPDQGEVVAAGPGVLLKNGKVRPLDVQIGDRVLFGKFAGQAIRIGNAELLVLREDELIAVLVA